MSGAMTRARHDGLVSYTLGLLLATSVLVAGSGAVIIANATASARRTSATLTAALFRSATRQAVIHTRDRARLAVPAVDLLARRLADAPALAADRDALVAELLDTLRANPALAWASWTDAAGAFTGANRTADGTLHATESTIHDDGRTEWVEWRIGPGGERTETHHEADTHYDPRTRPYYRLGASRGARAWTEPYVFSDPEAPGITCVAPVFAAPGGALRGVVTVDLDLDELSRFIASVPLSSHGRLFVVAPDGTLLASGGEHLIRRARAGGAPALVAIRSSADPVLRAYQAEVDRRGLRAAGDVDTAFEFRYAGAPWLAAFAPFEVDQGMRWVVGAAAPTSDFTGDVDRAMRVATLVSAITLAAALALAALVARRMSRRLVELAGEMDRVGELRLDDARPAPPTLLREIAVMNRALAGMRQGLRAFARYVPRDLVRAVVASGQEVALGGRTRTLTVFFSDIAGFTSVAEEMTPDALVAMLGGYLEAMTAVIARERGTVDKFIGDGIMAFWGAPAELEDHAARACAAALGCQRELARLQREGPAEMQRLATRIGLATGEVLVGNIGTPERLNYTVMGDVVNLASRLEGLNKQYGTRAMASEETVRAANGRVVARAIDVVAVKGKARGVKVYELMALASEGDARAERVSALSEEALEAYMARDFARAEERWARVLDELPDDRVAALMRDRARAFAVAPPPAEWNGVYASHEK